MTRPWPLVIRRAQARDEAAVMSFASQTWGGWDYMPRAWSRWIDAVDGVLLVGEVGEPQRGGANDTDGPSLAQGDIVSVVRVAMPATTEAWLEGIRVDPRVRGMDVATDLQVGELQWAAANGARIVRYATSARNEGSIRLGARGGFELLTRLDGLSLEPAGYEETGSGFDPQVQSAASTRRRRVLDDLAPNFGTREDRVSELWQAVSSDASFRLARQLYEPRPWALEELTETKFREHVRRGEVLVRGDGPDTAVAVLVARAAPAEESAVRLSTLVGHSQSAWELARALASVADAPVRFRYAVDAPVIGASASLYRDNGWESGQTPMHIMARPIDADHPVPAVDPSAVVMADPPKAVITPAQ